MDTILVAVLTIVGNGLITWGVLQTKLAQMQKDLTRAHKRLDLIGAPNVTLED